MLRPDESVKYDFWVGGILLASFSVYIAVAWRGGSGTRAWSLVYYLWRKREKLYWVKLKKKLKSVLFSMQKRGHIMISAIVKMNMKDGLK